jgi:hypothetical protein
MAAERQIHNAVLERCGLAQEARTPVAVAAEAEVDEFLF